MPLISVVLPTWNRAPQLRESIGSVLAQTFRDLELIVVDDGSTDATQSVVAEIHDPRLRYVRLGTRGGVSRARNHGLDLAQSTWIAFQDSDDRWLPDKLQRQLDAAADDVHLVVTRDRVVNDSRLSYQRDASSAAVLDITDEVPFRVPPAATWLARRDVLRAVGGFDAEFNCYEDWDLALRMTRGRVVLVNRVLVERCKSAGSLFSDEPSRFDNLQRIVARHRARLAADARAWAYYCNALGQMSAQAGYMRQAGVWFLQALRARPLAPRSWLNLLLLPFGRLIFARYVAVARQLRSRVSAHD